MIDAAVTFAFIAAVIVLGLRGGRGPGQGLNGYVLAGRTLTLPLFVSTLVPTFYGGVLGIGEFTWRNGLSNWLVMAFPYYVFAAIYAFFLAGRIRLESGLTIPDHLERAYGRPLAVFAAGLVFLLACPADELLMVGSVLTHLSGWALPLSMAAAGAAGLGLVMRGGLRSDVAANRLQLVMMFGGFAVILPFAVMKLGGLGALQAGLPLSHLTLTGGLRPLQLAGWWLLALWTLVDPAFHQRCAAAESPEVARRGILVSIGFWALFDLMTTTAGLYARLAEPALTDPLLAFPVLADRLLPPVARGLFFAGMSASMFAALQGTALLSAVSLGKDGLGRWLQAPEETQERWSKAALPVTGALAFALALALPSVVGLWYAIGSIVIPGLLLPLLGVYFPRLRAPAPWALTSAVCGTAMAGFWLWRGAGGDPMFPGLGVAAALWTAGLYRGGRSKT